MADILQFRPRPPRSADRLATDQLDVRVEIEAAAQFALDTANRLIAVLNDMDSEPDDELHGDDVPSRKAPDGHDSQMVWLRGTGRNLKLDAQPATDS